MDRVSPPCQRALFAARSGRYGEMVPGPEDGSIRSRFDDLYASAREARSSAHRTVLRADDILQESNATRQEHRQSCARAERLHQLWQSGQDDRLRHSAYARLQARLATMPVIEQAKGVLMAQFGWTAEEAFDALRRASQRSNIRVRDLADRIVANTARAAQARKPAGRQAREPAASLATTGRALPAQRRRRATAG